MRKKIILELSAAMIVMIFMVSCAKQPPHIARGEIGRLSARADEVLDNINAIKKSSQTIKAMIHVYIEDGENNRGTDAALIAERPAKLRFDAMDSLADVWAMAATDEKTVWLYMPAKRKLYRGKSISRNLRRLVDFDLEISELVSLMTGVPPVGTHTQLFQIGKRNENHFLLRGGRYHLWTERYKNYISMCVRYGDEGRDVNYVAEFKDYKHIGDIWFPHTIEITFPKRGAKATIRYLNVSLDEAVDSSVFLPPTKRVARTIDLENGDAQK